MSSRPIQTQCGGLLGFLQLKNMGKNPAELPDTLQSVLDLREWFFETNAELEDQSTIAVSGTTAFTALTVPAQQIHAVLDLSAFGTMAVGNSMRGAFYMQAPGRNPLLISPLVSFVAGEQAQFSLPRDRIAMVPPGWEIGLSVAAFAGAAVNFVATKRFCRIQV